MKRYESTRVLVQILPEISVAHIPVIFIKLNFGGLQFLVIQMLMLEWQENRNWLLHKILMALIFDSLWSIDFWYLQAIPLCHTTPSYFHKPRHFIRDFDTRFSITKCCSLYFQAVILGFILNPGYYSCIYFRTTFPTGLITLVHCITWTSDLKLNWSEWQKLACMGNSPWHGTLWDQNLNTGMPMNILGNNQSWR